MIWLCKLNTYACVERASHWYIKILHYLRRWSTRPDSEVHRVAVTTPQLTGEGGGGGRGEGKGERGGRGEGRGERGGGSGEEAGRKRMKSSSTCSCGTMCCHQAAFFFVFITVRKIGSKTHSLPWGNQEWQPKRDQNARCCWTCISRKSTLFVSEPMEDHKQNHIMKVRCLYT